jgi:hypothetical protein
MSMCNPVRDTQPAYRSPYDWNECGSSHALHAFYSVEHRLADGNAECASHKGPGTGNFISSHHHRQEAHIEDRGSTQDTEVDLETGDAHGGGKCTRRSALRGDVDSAVRITLGRRGSDTHLTRVDLEDTTARSAPGGYGGQADLTGMEVKAGGKFSTISLNREEMAGAEYTG